MKKNTSQRQQRSQARLNLGRQQKIDHHLNNKHTANTLSLYCSYYSTMLRAVVLALFAASVAAFQAPAKVQMPSRAVARAAPTMSFKSDMAKVAAVSTAMMAPAAAFARLPEGTNAILGIDVAQSKFILIT
jgi:trans-aconitate methyltransferase